MSSATIYPTDSGLVVRATSSPTIVNDPPSVVPTVRKSHTAPPIVQSPPSSPKGANEHSSSSSSFPSSSFVYTQGGEEGHSGWWPSSLGLGFYLAQNTSESCRFGLCQPEIDWHVGQYATDISAPNQNQMGAYIEETQHILFVKEHSTWCMRTCSCLCPGARAIKYMVHKGSDANGPPFIRHEKRCTSGISQWAGCLPVRQGMLCFQVPFCCNLPYLETYDAVTNKKLGTSRVLCDSKPLCCPKFGIYDEYGLAAYRVHPDLCCCNCSYRWCASECSRSGQKSCVTPYYFRHPASAERSVPGDEDVAIIGLWAGVNKGCCKTQHAYGVKYPPGVSDAMKATIMGTTFLYNLALS